MHDRGTFWDTAVAKTSQDCIESERTRDFALSGWWVAAMSTPQQPNPALGRAEEAGSPPTTNVRPQRGSITSLLILSLVFLMMTNNGGGDDLAARNQYKDSLSSLEWQLGNYSVWLNGSDTTNFTLVSGTP